MMRPAVLALTALSLAVEPLAEAFIATGLSRLSSQSRVLCASRRSADAPTSAAFVGSPSAATFARLRCPVVSPNRRPSERWLTVMSADGDEGGSEMALLRNDKFKGLIVLLRNISPNEWVTEVEKMYPGDDEVKGMLGKVGKLMNMMDYYEDKKKK